MKGDLKLLTLLRNDARETLTNLSKKTKIPVSTLHDKLRFARHKGVIQKFTVIPNYEAIGYNTRATMLVKTPREHKASIRDFLALHPNVNSLFKINNGYDLLIQGVFTNMHEIENFLDILEIEYRARDVQVFYILENIVEEMFLSDPSGIRQGQFESDNI
jgi:DNA-binding Lrp family transcriptional regulator